MASAPIKAHGEYARRIDRVIDYIRANLDRTVSLDELAGVACFSAFHFHRIFSVMTGETVNGLANRLRLEKAARLLRYSDRGLVDIALDCGFSSPAVFSRAFRAAYDTSPSAFRRNGEIEKSKIRKDLFRKGDYYLPLSGEEKKAAFPVRLIDLPQREAAYIRVVNTEGGRVLAAFERMIGWAKSQHVFEEGSLFGMSLDDPHVTPQKLYRYEVCLAAGSAFTCADGMSKMTLPAKRYAALRVSGDIRMVATAWDYLFRDWLVASSHEPEHAPSLEIFLDKDKATDWSHFELDLCVPIKQLERTGD
jgi:AraC family transcriptional regulator